MAALSALDSLAASSGLPVWLLCIVVAFLVYAFVLICGYLFKLLVFKID